MTPVQGFVLLAAVCFFPSWAVGIGAAAAALYLLIAGAARKRVAKQRERLADPKNVVLFSAYRRGHKNGL